MTREYMINELKHYVLFDLDEMPVEKIRELYYSLLGEEPGAHDTSTITNNPLLDY